MILTSGYADFLISHPVYYLLAEEQSSRGPKMSLRDDVRISQRRQRYLYAAEITAQSLKFSYYIAVGKYQFRVCF